LRASGFLHPDDIRGLRVLKTVGMKWYGRGAVRWKSMGGKNIFSRQCPREGRLEL
jgi:hypothetical protein